MTYSAFSRQVQVFVDKLPDLAAKEVQAQATRVVREVRQANSVPPAYRINIGGKYVNIFDVELPQNLPFNSNSQVVLQFDYRREIVLETLRILLQNSPEISGDYKDAFTLYIDGKASLNFNQAIKDIVPGARVQIINRAPYARKLEVGKRWDGSPFVLTKPPGMVERSASQASASKYQRLARIFFSYADLSDAYILQGSEIGSTYIDNLGQTVRRGKKKDRVGGQPISYPSITVAEKVYVVR